MIWKLLLIPALFAGSAFALGTTHCSSAQGEFMRSEKEIWGANAIAFRLELGKVKYKVISVDPVADTKKTVLDVKKLGDELDTVETTYVQKFMVMYQGDLSKLPPGMSVQPGRYDVWAICLETKNNAKD